MMLLDIRNDTNKKPFKNGENENKQHLQYECPI